jgi:hypothetical protein
MPDGSTQGELSPLLSSAIDLVVEAFGFTPLLTNRP